MCPPFHNCKNKQENHLANNPIDNNQLSMEKIDKVWQICSEYWLFWIPGATCLIYEQSSHNEYTQKSYY